MPLTATLDEVRIVAPLLTDDEWNHVKEVADSGDQSRLRIGYSDLPCYPRTSKAGVRHFVHRSGFTPDIKYATESAQHLKLKSAVVRAASATGWDARTEVMSEDRSWIADTLLIKGSVTIAVEIQWSRQSMDEYISRQKRYSDDGIRCAWIHRHQHGIGHTHTDDLPMFLVDEDSVHYDPEIIIDGIVNGAEVGRVPIDRFIGSLLSGEVKRSVVTYVLDHDCYHCGKSHTIWRTEGSPMFQLHNRMEFSDGVTAAVSAVIHQRRMSPMCYHKVLRTVTANVEYDAFTCPHCGTMQGDYFVHQEFSAEVGRTPYLVLSPSATSNSDHGRWMISSPPHSSAEASSEQRLGGTITAKDAISKMTGWDRY